MAGRVGWGLLLLLVLALFASGVVCQPGDGAASEETTPARQCPDYTWRTVRFSPQGQVASNWEGPAAVDWLDMLSIVPLVGAELKTTVQDNSN